MYLNVKELLHVRYLITLNVQKMPTILYGRNYHNLIFKPLILKSLLLNFPLTNYCKETFIINEKVEFV